jgi:small-conductance mechanosensitive channel
VLDWLEAIPFAVWLRESPSVWALPTVLTLHTTGMAVLVGASFVLDLRLLGISRSVPLSAFRWVFRAVAIGLIVNVATGVLLFAQRATDWGTSIPFLIKMCLVIASAATLLPIRSLVFQPGADRYGVGGLPAEAPSAKAGSARLLAIVSILAWCGAVTAGRLLAYVEP